MIRWASTCGKKFWISAMLITKYILEVIWAIIMPSYYFLNHGLMSYLRWEFPSRQIPGASRVNSGRLIMKTITAGRGMLLKLQGGIMLHALAYFKNLSK